MKTIEHLVGRKIIFAFSLTLAALLPGAVRAQTQINVPSAILETASYYADAQLIAPSTVSQWDTTAPLRCYYSNGSLQNSVVLVFQLPSLGGHSIATANLSVLGTTSNPNATHNTGVDLYAVRWQKNTSATTDTKVLTSDFPNQLAYEVIGNSGIGIMNNLLPLSTSASLNGTYSTSSAAQTALGTWLQAQYNAGAVAGDYVFLRLNVNSNAGGSLYYGWTVNSANAPSNPPVLTITTAAPINLEAPQVASNNLWWSGTTTQVRGEGATLQIGRVSQLSAGVCYFALPDLDGAAITSAQLVFTASGTSTSTYTTNISLEAIRSAAAGSVPVASDYTGIGSSGTMIQANIANWTDTMPHNYATSTSASTALGNWLTSQYASVGAGGIVFLRLEPPVDPVGSNTYINVPEDSVQLIITTNGNVAPSSGVGNTVSAMVGNDQFSWTFDQPVQWGYFIDGQPWVVMPASGNLHLTAASPSRLNSQNVYTYTTTSPYSAPYVADINITVRNPPLDHTFNGSKWVDNSAGVFGWDSRAGHMGDATSPIYNSTIGWDGVTPLALAVGDSITTPCSMTGSVMPSRATMLDALGVLTVLGSVPPSDAFRPAVIRTGTDRTNPTIITYSNLISNLDSYLIADPTGTTDLTGTRTVAYVPEPYRFYQMQALLNGPWFINTGYSLSEGVNGLKNNTTLPVTTASVVYGGNMGTYMGQVAVGCLASWLSPAERETCRILYIQRAIDVYGAVKAGLCLETGAGIMPGYSTLLTNAGYMLNNASMLSVNNGVMNGANLVKPYWIFADYATMWHTDGVPSSQLFSGETTDRLVPLYSNGTITNYPEYNRAGISPIAASDASSMTMQTTFQWGRTERPINDILNMKVQITGGAGAGSTIYTITNALTSGVTAAESFRTTSGTLYVNGGNTFGYVMGGKVQVTPNWANGLPDSTSVLTMSITANDTSNPTVSDYAKWYYNVVGVTAANPPTASLDHIDGMNTSPEAEYASVHTGGTIDELIVTYALGAQSYYKGGLDQYMIQVGQRPGYGEVLFQGSYLNSIGGYGTAGNPRGALWKQVVLTPLGDPFVYTTGTTSSLPVANSSALLWNQP